MEVALLVCNEAGSHCVGLGVIEGCSPQGIYYGFLVLYSFFVIVNVTRVNSEYKGLIAYCEEATVNTLSAMINHRV